VPGDECFCSEMLNFT